MIANLISFDTAIVTAMNIERANSTIKQNQEKLFSTFPKGHQVAVWANQHKSKMIRPFPPEGCRTA